MLLPLVSALLVQLPAAPVGFQAGVLTPPLVGEPGAAALRYATSQFPLDPRSTLVVRKKLGTRFGGSVHLSQQVAGLDVHGSRVVVTFDDQQRVVRVSSSLKRFAQVKTEARLTAPQALEIATHEIDGAWLRSDGVPYGGATQRAFVVNGALHAGFLVFVPTLKASDSWHVAVDAVDGAVLWVENRVHAARAAKVYASSPGGVAAGVGVTPTLVVELTHLPGDGGYLTGERIRAINCCPTFNCQTDAGPARATGQAQTFGGVVNFDVAICDQRQRATNDPAVHPSGDYVYAPVDPPNTAVPSINTPADFDEFAEVHAYHHVSRAYEAVRRLSLSPSTTFSPFAMRNAGPDLPAVWVNVADADLQGATPNAQGVYVNNALSRTDNALFLARENMEYLLLPPQVLASDALVIYQGARADFAYDGPVLWHEFGHGVIHSTADWDTVVAMDARSANNESSALHEGVADLIAVMTGNDPVVGAYVGPRIDPTRSAIRNVANTSRCPDSLWGESHEDSLHFTGAIWEARSRHFLGLDQGATFDAALYAAIVSFPPDVNFQKAADIITAAQIQAFPNTTGVRAKMTESFDGRGVTNCSKVLDVTTTLGQPRIYFGIAGSAFAEVTAGSVVPGPYQFKVKVPRGAKSVTVSGPYQGGGGTVRLEVLASADQPITFAKSGMGLINDAQARVVPTASMGVMTGKVNVAVPCGGELFFAVGNTSQRDRTLYDLRSAFEAADSCPEPPDAGPPTPEPVLLAVAPGTLGAPVQGCGCGSVVPLAFLPALWWLARRRK